MRSTLRRQLCWGSAQLIKLQILNHRHDSERARQIDQEQKDEEVARKLLLADRQMQEVWMKKKREVAEKDEEVARRMAEEERDEEKM